VTCELPPPVAIAAHDAGGAEVLSSYVARHRIPCKFVLEGPARKVFERKLGSIAMTSLADAISTCNSLLCGTSWESELEWRAIAAAQDAGKPAVAFLDHWVNYRKRFIRRDRECLPDAIWVGDAAAEQLARGIFSETPVHLVPNPYFEDTREEFAALGNEPKPADGGGLRVLFLCTPMMVHEQKRGYTEFDALRYFFDNRSALGKPVASLVIRPHPSEDKNKYREMLKEFGAGARLGGEKSLLQEVAECNVVLGCGSMAMVVALITGRRVISAIPPGGLASSLPQPEIESLQTLVRTGIAPMPFFDRSGRAAASEE
jgi:hypothetical protein